jgi:hypothetical protein
MTQIPQIFRNGFFLNGTIALLLQKLMKIVNIFFLIKLPKEREMEVVMTKFKQWC